MNILLMILPLVYAAAALAQDVEPQGAASAETTQEQDKLQAQGVPHEETQRQGADMRHCLELKRSRDIIRCAEPGRKP